MQTALSSKKYIPMTRPPLSLCLVLALCAGLLVTVIVPAHAIQYMTPGEPGGGGRTSEKKTVVDKLKKKWEEQPEEVKEEVREQVDKAKDIAKEKVEGQAKKAGKKVWKKIKKLKTFGKYAKKAGEALKRYKRVLGPVGQVWDAAERGYKTGGKIHQRIVGPLMAAHFDRKDEEWQRQLQEDIARIRRNAQHRNNQTPASPAPEPDTLEHYADQQLQEYMDALPPLNDSQEGYAEALEQYSEATGSEQPAPYETPQEPYQDNYMDDLPPMDDSQDGYMEALERYNEALRSEQPAPSGAPQEPYREAPVDNYQAALNALNQQEAEAERKHLQPQEASKATSGDEEDQRRAQAYRAADAVIEWGECMLEHCKSMYVGEKCNPLRTQIKLETERLDALFASRQESEQWTRDVMQEARYIEYLERSDRIASEIKQRCYR